MSLTVAVRDIVAESGDPLLAAHTTWARVLLGEIARVLNGAAFSSSRFNNTGCGMPLIRIRDVGQDRTESFFDGEYDNRYEIVAGDLVVGMDGGFRCARWRGPKALLNQRVCKIDVHSPGYVSGFLDIALPGYLSAINERTSSVTVRHLSSRSIAEIPLPLPPVAEQHRIVAKVEELFAQVDSARDRLARLPTILKRFRQSILAAACAGRLTSEWREHAVGGLAPVPLSTMLATFHRVCWERAQVERMTSNGKTPKNDKWKDAYAQPTFEPFVDQPKLPNGWEWIRIGLLGENPLTTVQTGPFGAQLHNDEFTDHGVPVIAVGNLTGMGFKQDDLYFITSEKAADLSRYDVQAGDVLFARSGATLGKVCVAPECVRDWRMTGHILRLRVNKAFVVPEIVVFALHGDPWVRDQVTGNIRGITRPGFNTSLLESIAIPVPPLAEQYEIVHRVDALFKLADAIERRAQAATARVERLTQAILAKAFRGELVPTEAELARTEGREFESASVLLERIRAERAAAETNGAAARTPRPRRQRAAKPTATAEAEPAECAAGPTITPAVVEPAGTHQHAGATNGQPPPIDGIDRNEVLATIRQVFGDGQARDREAAIQDVARALGYRRVGARIHEILTNDIQTAVRRGILENAGGNLSLLCHSIDDYAREHLVEMLVAAMVAGWQSRDEAITAAARHLGYRRTGPAIRAALQSAINSAIRSGRLERDGAELIRRSR